MAATYTFAFASDAQGLADGGNSSSMTFAAQTDDGNPQGCVKFTLGTKSVTQTEYGLDGAGNKNWETYGVPSGATVNSVSITGYSEKTTTVTKLSSHSWTMEIRANDNTANVHGSTPLVTVTNHSIVADGSWQSGTGMASAQNVTSSYQASNTNIRFRIAYTATTGGTGGSASVDQRFDQVVISINYTAGPSYINGYCPGTSGAGAVLKGAGKLAGGVTGVAAAGAKLSGVKKTGSLIEGTSFAGAKLLASKKIYAGCFGTANVGAVAKGSGALRSGSAGTGFLGALAKGTGNLRGGIFGIGATGGDLKNLASGNINGWAGGTGFLGASLKGSGKLAGICEGLAFVGGNLSSSAGMFAGVEGSSLVGASLKGAGRCVAALAGTSLFGASIQARGRLTSTIAGTGFLGAKVLGIVQARAGISGSSTAAGYIKGRGLLVATVPGTGGVGANLGAKVSIGALIEGVGFLGGFARDLPPVGLADVANNVVTVGAFEAYPNTAGVG